MQRCERKHVQGGDERWDVVGTEKASFLRINQNYATTQAVQNQLLAERAPAAGRLPALVFEHRSDANTI